MKHETGNFQVTRRCCTSGNCFTCLGTRSGTGSVRVVHADNYSRAYAEYVAGKWGAYDAKVEPMPAAPATAGGAA